MTDYIWAPEHIWNAWAIPLIQVAAAICLFMFIVLTLFKITKIALGK